MITSSVATSQIITAQKIHGALCRSSPKSAMRSKIHWSTEATRPQIHEPNPGSFSANSGRR